MLMLAIKEGSNAACCMWAVYSIHRPVRAPVSIYIHICICLQRTQKSIMEPREEHGVVWWIVFSFRSGLITPGCTIWRRQASGWIVIRKYFRETLGPCGCYFYIHKFALYPQSYSCRTRWGPHSIQQEAFILQLMGFPKLSCKLG